MPYLNTTFYTSLPFFMLSLTVIKRLFKPPLLLFVLYACQPLAEVAPDPTYTSQKPTTQWVPVANPAVQARLNALPTKGAAQSFKVGQGLNTHALATYNGANVWYTMPLGQGSIAGWQNLVLGPTAQQSYVLHYQPASSHLLAPLEAFSGQVKVLNVSGTLLSSLTLQNGQLQASAAAGRAGANQRSMLNECVVDVHMHTEQQPVISNTTGLPVPGEVTQVTVVELVYGPCPIDAGGGSGGSNTGALPSGAGSEGGGTVQPGGPGGIAHTPPAAPADPPDTVSVGLVLDPAALNQRILAHKLEENPFLLLDIPCNKIKDWQALAQHQVPQEVLDRMDALGVIFEQDFIIQLLENAHGAVVNMDEYGVEIDKMPLKPDGSYYSPEELLNEIRLSIKEMVDADICNFRFYPGIEELEQAKWEGNDPVGTVFSIGFPKLGVTIADGSVVCTKNNPHQWIFTTVWTPADGTHPVSGNRVFGFEQLDNGEYYFYTRGVDRLTWKMHEIVNNINNQAFNSADNTWLSFQTLVTNHIINKGGSASVANPVTYRPDWEEVEAVLKGNSSIESLDGCN